VSELIFRQKKVGLDITPFIRDLILLNECVILRGVGGFETSYKNAAFRKNKKAIAPPGKHVHFRPELLKDNGVLEKYIQKSTGISSENASEQIDIFVNTFFEQLRESGKVLLNGIGEFALDENSKLKFQEFEDVNYLADSFGLDTLDIIYKSLPKEESKETKPPPVVLQRRKLTGWYVAIGVLLLVVTVTFIILIAESAGVSIFNFTGKNKQSDQSETVVFGPQISVEKDSLTKAIEETINQKTSPKTALAISTEQTPAFIPVQKSTKTELSNNHYFLIAGSFKNARNAEILKEQLLRKGFVPEVYHREGDYYRVVIGRFNNRQEAIDELRRIRKQIDQSIWLWERN
jgi:cell division septation protein DedD